MDYNYHTHTYLCAHASGNIESYIRRAIKGGIKYMGFSDHAPFLCANGEYSHYRIHPATAGFYFSELNRLREKYKNEIDIKIGFEMEYYPNDFEKMLKNAIDYGAEYLILGQHFLEDESVPGTLPCSASNNSEDFLKKYVNNVVDGIKTGAFTYVAHPDLCHFSGSVEIYDREMIRICKASEKYNIPLEINFLGIRTNRHYPFQHFWELAGTTKAPVTFGFDAHTSNDACDRDSLAKAMEMVERYNLNYIGKPEIIPIQKA